MSAPVADAAERLAALDVHKSFCVQAPAGSGKTELLTQRILNLLANCERPEEILAFTFTRKAAAEMRSRLLNSLHKAATADPAAIAALPAHAQLTHKLASAVLAQDAAKGWQLLGNSQRLRINTIDSFTSFLTGQLPLGANFGAQPRISTNMDAIFEQAIHDTLAWLDRDGAASAALAHLLAHLHGDLGRIERLLLDLLHKRDQWLPLVAGLQAQPHAARELLEANLRAMLDDALQSAATKIASHKQALLPLLQFAAANQANLGNTTLQMHGLDQDLPDASAAHVAAWRELAQFFMVKSLEGFRKRLTKVEGFPAPGDCKDRALAATLKDMKAQFADTVDALTSAGLLPVFQLLAKLPDASYSDRQWQMLSTLTAILPLLAAELNVAMRQAGQIDHTETSLAALHALGTDNEPTDLALRLDYRIRHILVDEFQDTSSMQFHLIEKLVAGWQEGDGRTLFIVGDGMQSCYGFRNANVGLFLRARDSGIGSVSLEPLNLRINFRSDSSVVDWVNKVFSTAFPLVDDIARGGVCYSPSKARHTTAETRGIACQFWIDENEETVSKESRRDVEADAVARLCQQLVLEDPDQSIAILVPARSHLDCIVPALRRAGLHWNASEIDKLLSYPAIGDLFTLLRAVLNPADTTAWFALLRTPFVGLALADIEQLALHTQLNGLSLWSTLQQHPLVTHLSADAAARLQRCVPSLQRARALRQTLPLSTLLEYLWIDLGGPACVDNAAVLPNVTSFLELIDEEEAQGDLIDIHRFETRLQKCFGSATATGSNLHIMTIHKAKGLEFDTVILPGLDRTTRGSQKDLLLWREYLDRNNASRPLFAVLQSKGDEDEPLYQYLRYEAALRDNLENTRLLYIAVTRAAKQAWLSGNLKSGKNDELSAPGGSLLHTILPQLLAQQDQLDVTFTPLPPADVSPITVVDAAPVRQVLRRLPAQWQSPLPEPLLQTAVAVSAEADRSDQYLGMAIGELVHLGLKSLVEQGPQWLAACQGLPYWNRVLRPLCHDEASLQQALATVHTHLQQCADSPHAEWLFNPAHPESACELALCDYSNGYRRDFVVDRTFIDADGQRWIIDYKAASPIPDQDLDDFLAAQSQLYQQQLANYARLLARADEPTPRVALFFTGIPLLHELVVDEPVAV